MMKYLKYFFAVIILCAVSACSDDKDDEPAIDSLLGRWELLSSEEDESYWEKPCIFNFKENGMLVITFASGKDNQEDVACRYTTAGSKLTIDFAYGDEVFEGTYKISNDVLTFDMISYLPGNPSEVYTDFLILMRK